MTNQLPRNAMICFDYTIDQGLAFLQNNQPIDISLTKLVSIKEYFSLVEQMKTDNLEEIISVQICDKIVVSIEQLKSDTFYFIQEHQGLFQPASFPQKLYEGYLLAEKDEYEVDFEQYIEKFRIKENILIRLQKSSISQLQGYLINLEEKIPSLAQLELEKIVHQYEIEQLDDVINQIKEEVLEAQLNQTNQIKIDEKDISFTVEDSLIQSPHKIRLPQFSFYNHQSQISISDISQDQLSTDEENNDLEELPKSFTMQYPQQNTNSEKEATMNKKTFSEIIKNMTKDSPYAMNYYRRGVSTVEAAFPYMFRYQLPLQYKSSGDNQFIIDAKKDIATRITNAWVKGKYNDTKQLINENQDIQALIKELVQAGMSSTRYRDFKHTPIAGSDQSIQMFNHLMYDIVTQYGKLDNPTDDDFKKLDQHLQEKFSIMVENNTGRLILLSENYMSRIKSPDGLSLFNSFLVSAILATFRLKAKELAVTYAIRDQDVAFPQDKVPMQELCQNIDGLNRKCAILAYQNFVRDNISNLAIDEGDSLERFQDQLWQKTSAISANIACWMTTIFECCENQDRTQQSPQSIQFYIQRSHFLTDFIEDYPNLDNSITRNATWTKLAQTELFQTTEEQVREALIIISKLILRLQVSTKELEKFKRYIYTTECF